MKSFLILTLIFVSAIPSIAGRNGIELTLTISGKIFIGINHRLQLTDRTMLRYGVSMGFLGSPAAVNAGVLQQANSSGSWAPYLGIGMDAVYSNVRGRKILRPYLKTLGGIAYQPLPNLAQQAELWLAVFPARKKIVPVGISFSHFNAVLK